MEFWKSVDGTGTPKDVKVIISDKLLEYNGIRISDFTNIDIASMYDLYDIQYSKSLRLIDDNGKNKMFRIWIDDVYIAYNVDNLYFITGGKIPYYNNDNPIIEGTLSDPDDKDSDFIIFAMQIKDTVFIDIDIMDGIPVIKISACNSFTSDIISSILESDK